MRELRGVRRFAECELEGARGEGVSITGDTYMKKIKVKQLVTGMFVTDNGGSYCIIGLASDGCVYRYDTGCMGWFPLPMTVTKNCEHRR